MSMPAIASLHHLKRAGGGQDVKGKTILVVATGGNVSLADFMAHVNHA